MPESTLKDFFFWTGILARAAVLMAKDRPGLFFFFLGGGVLVTFFFLRYWGWPHPWLFEPDST